jgi:hypothetical protein
MKKTMFPLIVLIAMAALALVPAVPAAAQTAEEWFDMGYTYYDAGDLGNSIVCYTNCIELDPGNAVAYNNRGVCYEDYYMWWDQSMAETNKMNALSDYKTACDLGYSDACGYYNHLLGD